MYVIVLDRDYTHVTYKFSEYCNVRTGKTLCCDFTKTMDAYYIRVDSCYLIDLGE